MITLKRNIDADSYTRAIRYVELLMKNVSADKALREALNVITKEEEESIIVKKEPVVSPVLPKKKKTEEPIPGTVPVVLQPTFAEDSKLLLAERNKDNDIVAKNIKDILSHFAVLYNSVKLSEFFPEGDIQTKFVDKMHEFAQIVKDELDDAAYNTLTEVWNEGIWPLNGKRIVSESIEVRARGMVGETTIIGVGPLKSGLEVVQGDSLSGQIYSSMMVYIFFMISTYKVAIHEKPLAYSNDFELDIQEAFINSKNNKPRPTKDQMINYREALEVDGLYVITGIQKNKAPPKKLGKPLVWDPSMKGSVFEI